MVRARVRVSAVAIGAAVLTLASSVSAQEWTARGRALSGYLTERRSAGQARFNDLFVMASPELSLFWGSRDSVYDLTYTLTGGLRSQGASDIANRLTFQGAMRLNATTTFIASASAFQSTLANLLVTAPISTVTRTTGTALPSATVHFVGAALSGGLRHELTPLLSLTHTAEANAVTALAPTPPLDTLVLSTGIALERLWAQDALGGEARITYFDTRTVPPFSDRQYAYVELGPRWRHDWTRSLSSTLSGGASALLDPVTFYPSGRAALLYTMPDLSRNGMGAGSIELAGSTGIVPSPLTGVLTRTHQATLTGQAPIIARARIFGTATLGYGHADLIDPAVRANSLSFDSVVTDLTVGWQAKDYLQAFVHYQFLAQIGETSATATGPSFLRDTVFVGVELSSRAPGRNTVNARLPQRVDESDVPPPAAIHGPEMPLSGDDSNDGRTPVPQNNVIVPNVVVPMTPVPTTPTGPTR